MRMAQRSHLTFTGPDLRTGDHLARIIAGPASESARSFRSVMSRISRCIGLQTSVLKATRTGSGPNPQWLIRPSGDRHGGPASKASFDAETSESLSYSAATEGNMLGELTREEDSSERTCLEFVSPVVLASSSGSSERRDFPSKWAPCSMARLWWKMSPST